MKQGDKRVSKDERDTIPCRRFQFCNRKGLILNLRNTKTADKRNFHWDIVLKNIDMSSTASLAMLDPTENSLADTVEVEREAAHAYILSI